MLWKQQSMVVADLWPSIELQERRPTVRPAPVEFKDDTRYKCPSCLKPTAFRQSDGSISQRDLLRCSECGHVTEIETRARLKERQNASGASKSAIPQNDQPVVQSNEPVLHAFAEVPESDELFAFDDGRIVLESVEEIRAYIRDKQGAPVVKLVNTVLMSAIEKGASDILIEPTKKDLSVVRYRVDGFLYDATSLELDFRDAMTACIKKMSKLHVEEKRSPQKGRIEARFRANGVTTDIDFLVSCQPTPFGEKVIISVAGALQAADSATDASRAYWEGHRNEMLANLEDEATKLLGIEKLSEAQVKQLYRAFKEEAREQAAIRVQAERRQDPTYDFDNDFVARYERGDKALLKEFAKSFLGEWRCSPEGQQKETARGWGTFHPEPLPPPARVDDSPPRGAEDHPGDSSQDD